VSDLVKDAVSDRVSGERPGRMRSLLAAAAVGVACATLAYKLLRSGDNDRIDYSPSEGDG
jgi:hypothetical protein